jgi:tetratricopeptide (TPR) repeat protein
MVKAFSVCLIFLAVFATVGCSDANSDQESGKATTLASVEDATAAVSDPLMLEIRSMEANTKQDTVLNREAGLKLLRAYQDYYNKHPNDTSALNYIFEAGRVAVALGKYEKAIELLANFHDGSRNPQRRAEAAYLVAFVYDAHLHLPAKAATQYNKVMELYPESPWAAQSRQALQLVGKSDEELLQFLKEKNPS